ncbi:MAG: glutamate 5-kinase [Methanomassiliicoccales archaeon]
MRHLNPKRIVVKIGTNTICKEDGTVDQEYIADIARQIVELESKGIQSIIVTSGAIGSGSTELKLNGKNKDLAMKQACAAVGQALLMLAYRTAFAKYSKPVGQILLTYGAFSDRKRYLNLRKTIDELFKLGVVPIVNENDVIATDEIDEIFGDNDKLSALVATHMDADLLLLLTDVDGLYDRNPTVDPDARLLSVIDEITKDIERIAGGGKNERSVGGMRTKITAAKIAMQSGCNMVIANGRLEDVILRVVAGEEIGTLFTSTPKYAIKERWILFASPRGKLLVDEGAEKAIREGKSLLLYGIHKIEGNFRKGDVVRIGNFAKGIVTCSSEELNTFIASLKDSASKNNDNIRKKTIVENENIVVLE